VKYWEIIAENLRNVGWNCGCMATTDGKGRPIWVVAAGREDAGRFIVNSDQELPAFSRTRIVDSCLRRIALTGWRDSCQTRRH
jgi:hypothetical protein